MTDSRGSRPARTKRYVRSPRAARRLDVLFGTAWRAAPGLFAACVAATLGTALLGLAYPVGFRFILDGAVTHKTTVLAIGVAVTALAVPGSWMLRLIGAALDSKLTDKANLRLAMHIGRLVNAAPFLEHYERPDYLAQIDTLRDRRRILASAPTQGLGMLRTGLQFAGAAALIALIWPPLLVMPLLALGPAVADRWAGRVEKRSDDKLADSRRLLSELFTLVSTAGPARELRTFGVVSSLLDRHAMLGDEVNRRALRAARQAAAWEAAGWILYATGFAAAAALLVLRAAHGLTSPGEVVEAIALLRRSQTQIAGASVSAGSFATASTTADRLLWLEDYVESVRTSSSGPLPSRLDEGIRLDHVSFTYPGQEQPALQDVDLALRAGSTVALVGENGAGKSTLVKLLTGMYRPDAGRITVDGTDLAAVGAADWRAATSGAFQDFVKFQMALGDGVGAGDLPRINDQDVVLGAVRQADGAELLEELPEGLSTLLGPWVGGRSLSIGQWQRLALARGLMRQAPLLVVLDEPTASLDAASEAALFTRYARASRRLGAANGTITVLVSHRFSTVHMADQIIVLERGRIAEVGDHATLMERSGNYAELFTLQAKAYTDG